MRERATTASEKPSAEREQQHPHQHPQQGKERDALLFGLGAVLLWSTVATGFKLGLAVMAPVQLLFLGTCLSAIIFAAAAAPRGWPRREPVLKDGILFGIVNPVLYYLVLLEAYDRLPAQIAQPLNYTWAIVLAVLAVPVLGQRLTGRTLGGIAIGYLGVLVLLSQGRFDVLPDLDGFGLALAVLSTVLWAGYWLYNARSTADPTALMATSFCFAVPVLALLCLLGPGLPEPSLENLAYGAWVGAIEMGFSFLLWQQALRRSAEAGRISQLIFLSPFISLILIGTVLGETIHLTSWLGLGIIVLGLLITGRPASS
ncbi:MAG: DMT family transporter [Pseudomonadota bacterium]